MLIGRKKPEDLGYFQDKNKTNCSTMKKQRNNIDRIIKESIDSYLRKNVYEAVLGDDGNIEFDDHDSFKDLPEDEARDIISSWDADTQIDLNDGIDAYDPL